MREGARGTISAVRAGRPDRPLLPSTGQDFKTARRSTTVGRQPTQVSPARPFVLLGACTSTGHSNQVQPSWPAVNTPPPTADTLTTPLPLSAPSPPWATAAPTPSTLPANQASTTSTSIVRSARAPLARYVALAPFLYYMASSANSSLLGPCRRTQEDTQALRAQVY